MSPLGIGDILRRSQNTHNNNSTSSIKSHHHNLHHSFTDVKIQSRESLVLQAQAQVPQICSSNNPKKFLENIVPAEQIPHLSAGRDERNPLLRLMSISCLNEVGLVALPNCPNKHNNSPPTFLHSDIIASSSSSPPSIVEVVEDTGRMLLKSEHLPGGSPIPVPSPNSSGSGHPESPKSTAADPGNHGHHNHHHHRLTPPDSFSCTKSSICSPTQTASATNPTNAPMNDEDEVLSIGRDDDDDIHRRQILMDCDSSVLSDSEEAQKIKTEDCHNNNKSTSPQRHNESEQGDFMEDDDRLSQNSSEMELGSVCRARKYSSEDSFTIKSLCSPNNYHHNANSNDTTTTSTASPPPHQLSQQPPQLTNGANNNNHHLHHQFRHNSPSTNGNLNNNSSSPSNASLIFSIANILRPDFGLGTSAANTNPFIPHKNLKSPPITDFNYKHSSHQYAQQQQQHKSSGGSHKKHQSPMLSSNPIDLSRPTSASSHLISHHNPHHLSHHHQINQLLHPLNHLQSISTSATTLIKGVAGPMSNGFSSSSNNTNGHGASSANTSASKHKLKGNHHNESSKTHNNKAEHKISSRDRDNNSNHSSSSSSSPVKEAGKDSKDGQTLWPAWVYCTRYSDRPSSGPRARRTRKEKEKEVDEKRPRTAFTAEQLARLKKEFDENRYLTEKRRQDLAKELRLHENQIKIWFQNKRAKLKKATGTRGGLALQLMAQGLYNHSTIPRSGDDDSD